MNKTQKLVDKQVREYEQALYGFPVREGFGSRIEDKKVISPYIRRAELIKKKDEER